MNDNIHAIISNGMTFDPLFIPKQVNVKTIPVTIKHFSCYCCIIKNNEARYVFAIRQLRLFIIIFYRYKELFLHECYMVS